MFLTCQTLPNADFLDFDKFVRNFFPLGEVNLQAKCKEKEQCREKGRSLSCNHIRHQQCWKHTKVNRPFTGKVWFKNYIVKINKTLIADTKKFFYMKLTHALCVKTLLRQQETCQDMLPCSVVKICLKF